MHKAGHGVDQPEGERLVVEWFVRVARQPAPSLEVGQACDDQLPGPPNAGLRLWLGHVWQLLTHQAAHRNGLIDSADLRQHGHVVPCVFEDPVEKANVVASWFGCLLGKRTHEDLDQVPQVGTVLVVLGQLEQFAPSAIDHVEPTIEYRFDQRRLVLEMVVRRRRVALARARADLPE